MLPFSINIRIKKHISKKEHINNHSATIQQFAIFTDDHHTKKFFCDNLDKEFDNWTAYLLPHL